MTKVLLVEDDNNLREIYEARLAAEGYDIATAKDGEDALATAKQQKPELIISDVMMPRISGFEMLDILRNTDGLKNVKIIMLTALGQNEDKDRAEHLGADRYLVKSQVTLEDIVKTAKDLLDGNTTASATASVPTASVQSPQQQTQEDPTPAETAQEASSPANTAPQVLQTSEPTTSSPIEPEVAAPNTTGQPQIPTIPLQSSNEPVAAPIRIPVISAAPQQSTDDDSQQTTTDNTQSAHPDPLGVVATAQDFTQSSNATTPVLSIPEAQSESEEEAQVKQQIDEFIQKTDQVTTSSEPSKQPADDSNTNITSDFAKNNAALITNAAEQLSNNKTEAAKADAQPEPQQNPTEDYDDESSGLTQIPGKKVIQPLEQDSDKADLATLLAEEEIRENMQNNVAESPVIVNTPEITGKDQTNTPPLSSSSPSPQTTTSVFKPQSNEDDSFNAL